MSIRDALNQHLAPALMRSRVHAAQLFPALGSVRGYVDAVLSGRLDGWVADTANRSAPLEIEIYSGEERIASSVADGFRTDLLKAGLGNGRHGFSCRLPRRLAGESELEVTVRVRSSGTLLPFAATGQTLIPAVRPRVLEYVAADIVNNCNLRCPFCLVDYSAVKKTESMREETFRKMLELIPCVPEEGFWLSCLHEPTLHPRLNDFIGMIPEKDRKKFWFTTNLAMPLSERTFHAWAESGLHHINISLDTMNPDLFAVLRKFGRYEVFKNNLEKLTGIFRTTRGAPQLRYITMAFRSNFEEIGALIERAHKEWLAVESEVRYTYNMQHISDAFRSEHYLCKEDWPILDARLAKLPFKHQICRPPEKNYEQTIYPSANSFDLLQVKRPRQHFDFEYPIQLRGRPDGSLLLAGKECDWSVNIHDIADPVNFFKNL